MSTAPVDHDIALPHAGLLAYFRRPSPPSQQPDLESWPSSHARRRSHGADQPKSTRAKDTDEESTFGFWGEHDHDYDDTQTLSHLDLVDRGYYAIYSFFCFCFAISICILGAFGAFFILDLVFTQLGVGTGMATWMTYRNVGRGFGNYEMQFCLATPNRQAPGPQTWRYIEGDGMASCATETLTMFASSTEVWKLISDDDVSIRDLPLKSGYEMGGHVLSVEDKVRSTL